MVLLMKSVMEHLDFREITGATFHQAQTRSYGWGNKNKLLTSLYENCIGGKTGFTKKSGRTLATVANKDDLNLIAVTLNAPNDWQDHIQMYEWGFERLLKESVKTQGDQELKNTFYTKIIIAFKKISGLY